MTQLYTESGFNSIFQIEFGNYILSARIMLSSRTQAGLCWKFRDIAVYCQPMPIVKEVHAHQPKIMVSPGPDPKIHNVPKLVVSKHVAGPSEKYDPAQEYTLRYRSKKHAKLPHVVKFSGGRTSGMLLFTLLENGLLDSARGDVIVFNNTSAEHPDTYRFVQECMDASRSYGIPFFQIEFQTYELHRLIAPWNSQQLCRKKISQAELAH